MKPGIYANCLGPTLLIALLRRFSSGANAADLNPLRPPDTSSPRATLQGFVETTDELCRRMKDVINSYAASDRLYLSPGERQVHADTFRSASKAIQSLDVSGTLSVLENTVAVERVLHLKEILDRIELPSFDDIPDRGPPR